MLDYGINFNVEEGAKKAHKELEEWNKKWQKLLKENPLKIDLSGTSFDDLVKSSSKIKSIPQNIDSVSSSLKSLRAEFRNLTSDEIKAGKGDDIINKYRRLREETGIYLGTLDQAVKAQDRMAKQSDTTTGSIDRQNKAFKKQSEILVQLKSYAMNFLSVYGGIRLTKNLIDITGQFEMQKVSLQAILRDAEKGEAIFERIKGLAVISPYTFKDLVSYTKQLSAFSVPYEELYDTTKMLADVSAGLGVDMSRIILAYGQVRSAAVLRGQELRQFTEAGIPLVDELAKKFTELNGKVVSTGEVFDLISQRKVSFEMVRDIFAEMTDEGGKFYKMQEKQAETLAGKVANLTDAFQIMLSGIGEKGSAVLKGSIDATRSLMQNYEKTGAILIGLAAAYGTYRTAVVIATVAQQGVSLAFAANVKWISLMEKAQKSLNKTMLNNPYVLAAAAVVGLSVAIYGLVSANSAAEIATKSLAKAQEARTKAIDDERSKTKELINQLKDETSTRTEKQLALDKLQKMYPAIFKGLDIEKIKYLDLAEAIKLTNNELERKAGLSLKDEVSQAQGIYDKLTKGQTSYTREKGKDIFKEAKNILGLSDFDAALMTWPKMAQAMQAHLQGLKRQEDSLLLASYNAVSNEEKRNRLIVERGKLQEELNQLQSKEKSQWGSDFADKAKEEQIEKRILSINKQIGALNESMKVNKVSFDALLKDYQSAKDTLSGLQQSYRIEEATEEQVDEASARVEELKKKLEKMGWAEPKPGEENKAKKDAEKRIKEYLDTIQSQVDEYRKKFEIWNTIRDSIFYDNGAKMVSMFQKGNVDLLTRPLIDAAELVKKGWEDAGDGIATVFSTSFQAQQDGREVMIHMTPILDNGSVLSENELADYVDNVLSGTNNILEADAKRNGGLGIVLNVDMDTSIEKANEWGEALHKAQEQFYSQKNFDIDFDITFDGEPDLAKYIKAKMQDIAKGGLNLNVDFLTADFKDILNGKDIDEQTKKALQDMFSTLRDMYFTESKEIQGLYDKYSSYIIKKQKLDEAYQKEREKLIKDGASKEILNEQFIQYTDASNKLATAFAEQDIEFNKFVNELADKSIEELSNLLMKIDLEMSKMIESGGDAETIAVLRAKIVELERLLRSQIGKNENDVKDSYKDWKGLQTILGKVDREIQDIGDNMGGVAGELVKFASSLTATTLKMVNSIVELSKDGILGIEISTQAAESAIKTLEKASVILAVIGAALKVYNVIKGLFENKEQKEYINKLEEDRNKIAREYNRILLERIAIEDNLFGGNDMQNLVNIINGYSAAVKKLKELQSQEAKVRDFYAPGRYTEYMTSARDSLRIKTKGRNWFEKNILGKTDVYENLEEWVRKNLGTELFGKDGFLNLDVAKEVAKLEQLDNKTREYLETLISVQEAKVEFEKAIAEMIDNTFGELGDSLTNALVEGFRNGSLAAEDFKEDITRVLEDVAKQMVRMLFLQKYIDDYKDKLKNVYSDYAETGDREAFVKNLLSATADFFNSAKLANDESTEFIKMVKEEGKKNGFDLFMPTNEKSNLTGISKSAASITEDTALILGGYLDSFRLKMFPLVDYMMTEHKTTLSEMMKQQVSMTVHLIAIEANTKVTAQTNTQMLEKISSVISPTDNKGAFAINVNT